MKISFSIPLKPISGKHNFAMRLATAMKDLGVIITNKKPNINLVFLHGVNSRCKNIYRLDGVLMNTSINYKKKNAILLKTMRQCDGVIYQNEFCKQAADVFLKKFAKTTIINNGASVPSNVKPYYHKRPYVLTLSRWRPHKRLQATVDGFINSPLINTHDLIVLGDPDYKVKHDRVIYAGQQKSDNVWQYITGCHFVVHLAYVDWCPNSVVESLICGKRVLHSEVGGTKFTVRTNGIAVDDQAWNFKPIDLLNVPRLKTEDVVQGYSDMLNGEQVAQANYLDIKYIAQKYIDYCREILG